MVGLLGQIIPIGLLLALGPTRIMSTILLLTSAHPMRNALAFLGGVGSLYLAVGLVTLLFFGRILHDFSTGTIIIDVILVAAGVFLLILAARSFISAPDPDAPPPGWMQRITTLSAGQAFLFGIILACSIRYLLIFLSGVTLIYEAELSPSMGGIALLVLIALMLICQIILVSLYGANAERARAQLSTLMAWLTQHNRAIMSILFLILGVIFLVKGLQGLNVVEHLRQIAQQRHCCAVLSAQHIVGSSVMNMSTDNAPAFGDIKPHQYKVFCTVANELSYVRAAEALLLSQPAVSQQIKALETRLDLRLFARKGRGIALTPAGARFLPHAERILALLGETSDVVSEIHALRRGSVLIGASKSTGAYVVPHLLAGFHVAYPQIRLTLKVADRLAIEEDLLTHQIDLAVIGLVKRQGRFAIERLLAHDLIVVAPPEHRLAGRSIIPLSELQWEPFLLREPGSGARMDTEALFERAGVPLRAAKELGDTSVIKEAVRAGLGIAVLFRQSVAADIASGELIELNVQGFPLERVWHVVHVRERRLSTAATALRAHLLSQGVLADSPMGL